MSDHKLVHWDRLRSIGEVRLVRLTVLAPFIGYLILFNEQVAQWLMLSNNLLPVEAFSYFWQETPRDAEELSKDRLFLIYFGLFFLGLGSILYSVACPYLLKRYGAASEYLQAELKFQTRFQIQRMLDELKEVESKPLHLEGLLDGFQKHFDGLKQYDDAAFEDFSKNVMIEHWKTDNVAHPLARKFTFAAYLLGFSVLALPALDTLLAVSKAYWS